MAKKRYIEEVWGALILISGYNNEKFRIIIDDFIAI